MSPNLKKGNRKTFSVKARTSYLKERERWFKGFDKSNAKFYSSYTWRKLRKQILLRDGICQMCLKNKNKYVTANVVDHIVPINKGGPKYDANNLQALCKKCHDFKSRKYDKGRGM